MTVPDGSPVVLIGDSIRLGYEHVVRRTLAGLVWSPAENCRSSREVIGNLERWIPPELRGPRSIVHLNAGLHDLRRTPETGGEPLVPPDEYRANLERIADAVAVRWDLRLILATTTPVDDERHASGRSSERHARDVRAYNATLLSVAASHGLPVSDLHAVVCADPEALLGDDGVHLSPSGNRVVGEAVAEAIRDVAEGR